MEVSLVLSSALGRVSESCRLSYALGRRRFNLQPVAVCRYRQLGAATGPELVFQDLSGEGVENFFLYQALQRAGPVGGVVSPPGQVAPGRLGPGQSDPAGGDGAGETAQLDLDDFLDLLAGQAVENDHVVDPVEELGAEVAAEGLLDLRFHL